MSKKKFALNPKASFSVVFILSLSFFISLFFITGTLDIFENKLLDFRFSFFNQNNKPSKEIIFIDINEESLEAMSSEIGGWPWPRGGIISRSIVDYIMQGNPSMFLFDVLYPQYSPKSPAEEIPNEDIELTSAASYYDNISHAVLFNYDDRISSTEKIPESFSNNFEIKINDAKSTVKEKKFNSIIKPFDPLYIEATNLHSVNHDEDADGVSRKSKLFVKYENTYFPLLALKAITKKINAQDIEITKNNLIINKSDIGKISIQLDKKGDMPINFYKSTELLETRTAASIIKSMDQFMKGEKPLVPLEEFKDKIVVLGSSAAGLKDIKVSPTGIIAGPYIHICAISNILEKQFLYRLPASLSLISMLLSIVLIVILTTFIKNSYLKNIIGFSYIIIYIIVALLLFKFKGVVLDMAYTIIISVISYLGSLAYLSLTEANDKKFLKATFGSYLAPELIDRMFENKTMPTLGGESKQITAYFTDIQGFSTFSEKLTAVQLVELLNEYLSAMTDILLGNMGTLDKYEGDAIISFFGAPLDVPDHPLKACIAAIRMQNKLLDLRDKWALEKKNPDEPDRNVKNLPPAQWADGDKWPMIVHDMMMRIGVNTGEFVVGNMGSATLMNYTMMGDSVNLAARLEAGAKQYGVFTLVSEFTINYIFTDEQGNKHKVGDFLEYRYIDKIVVVGKSEPVIVYEVVAEKGQLTDKEKKLFVIYREALKHYLSREWDESINKFTEAAKIERFPNNKSNPSKVYLERCEHFKNNPPQAGWDGTWVLTSK